MGLVSIMFAFLFKWVSHPLSYKTFLVYLLSVSLLNDMGGGVNVSYKRNLNIIIYSKILISYNFIN